MADSGKDQPKTKRKRRTFASATERCEGKRKYHAEVEKKRKQYVTDQIQRLGDLLPFDRPKDLNLGQIYVLQKSREFIEKLLKEQEELKAKFEEQNIRDEVDELRELKKKVSESEKEKKRLEFLLNQKKEMGVQCSNTGGEEEGEDRVDFNRPPSLDVSSPLFNEIDDISSSINWEPLNSLMTSLAPIATTTPATTNQYSDGIDLMTSPYMYQSCQYQDCQQQPRQTHSYQPASLDSFSVQALTASSASSTIHYQEPMPRYQQPTTYSPTKYITPHKEFNSQFSIRAIHESTMLEQQQQQYIASQPFSIERLTGNQSVQQPTPQHYGNRFNISEMIGSGRGRGQQQQQSHTMPLRHHNLI